MTIKIEGVNLSKQSFKNDFKRLPEDVQLEATDRIKRLIEDCKAGSLRFHKLRDFRPGLYSMDITSGKGKRYKATFELDGATASFQRIGTHREIDRSPK